MKLLTILAIAAVATAEVLHRGVATYSTSSPQPGSNPPDLGYETLKQLQEHFWERFRYPNNVKETESINSTIFAENVQGRVSDTRNFEGRELNTEYIFGLFAPSESISIIGQPGDWEITQFVANQNIASATTRVMFTFSSFGNMKLPVTIDTWLTWNEAHEISQYDVTFRWFGNLIQALLQASGKPIEEAQKNAVKDMAASVCKSHTKHCTGENQQYGDEMACFRFLTEQIRPGQSFELGMNTLQCRSLHEHMLKYRPSVHCSHIGPTGGGMCDDTVSYVDKVSENYFTNSPWIPTVI